MNLTAVIAAVRRRLDEDNRKCRNCGGPLSPGEVRARLHARCVEEYDDRMAW